MHTCEYLEKQRGARITYLDVDENGIIRLEELEKAITPETILISVMFANNEIGSVQPIKRNWYDGKGAWDSVPYRCSAGILSGTDQCGRMQHRYVKLQCP